MIRPQQTEAPSSSSRERLLQAAKRLFALQGYEQTATSAIARQAGTSESQLMRYFGGKVGLLEALFEQAWAQLNARIQTALADPASPRAQLLAVMQAMCTTLARDANLAMLLLFEGRRLRGGERRVRLSEGFGTLAELARGLVRRAQTAREIDRTLDAAAVTSALIGACEAMIHDRVLARLTGGRAFAEREMQRTFDAMLTGLAPRGSRGGRPPRPARRRRLIR